MYRKITEKLKDWQTSSIRKPLILQGARQVGKIYVANDLKLYYYLDETLEIDFITKLDDEIIPIEVKSGERVKAKSLNKYIDKYKPKYSIRISEKNFGYENNIKSIPLYAVHCIGKI